MREKLPYIPWYIGDWRKDPGVQALTFHDRGVWFEILCLMYESEDRGRLLLNGQPMPYDALARLLGLDKQVLQVSITKIMDYGVASTCDRTGALMNRRMVRDEEIRKTRQRCGALGGNPRLLNQEVNHNTNQIPEGDNDSSAVQGSMRGFEEFWAQYPKKKARGSAEKAWQKLKEPMTLLPTILSAIGRQKRGKDWQREAGQFIPYPATWLNSKGWLDEGTCLQPQASHRAPGPPPTWKSIVDEIRTLLDNPEANAGRLRELGHALPREAWSVLDGISEQNPLREIMRKAA